jgi:hypothetical protein
MGLGEVAYMDVVANRRTIRSIVIHPKNPQWDSWLPI